MFIDTAPSRPGSTNRRQYHGNSAEKPKLKPSACLYGVNKKSCSHSTQNHSHGKMIVLDGDTSRAEELAMLLRFLGHDPLIRNPLESLQDPLGDAGKPSAVFLGCLDYGHTCRQVIVNLRRHHPHLVVILIHKGDHTLVPEEIARLCDQRIDYPFHHVQLNQVLARICQQEARAAQTGRGNPDIVIPQRMTGHSAAMLHIGELIERVSFSEATVLITGESGTGKEVVARNLHYSSSRSKGHFVAVNCGAISQELLESELFGHEKGAFTGATHTRKGRFELAAGGTLFLDEIGDMPLDMQVKLLRVLQEKTFERVGSNTSINADVRIIAATHQNLEQMVEKGTFREDLYYRLCVFPIQVPALRKRIEDLPILIEDLLSEIEREQGITVTLSRETLEVLSGYGWPGNIRELQHLLFRLALLYPGQRIEPQHLSSKYNPDRQNTAEPSPTPIPPLAEPPLTGNGIDLKTYLSEIEIKLIQAALTETKGVVAQAAKLLQLRRTTLVEKMRRYGLKSAD